ncbi:unnamed protein product [Sphenostylis stenocarpa]|uniref:E2 ubiquitin-conjugating enzyme n=1 Tax=Sphenostylis stenocarpa TaxID=92480 RepID=A0AA86W4R0_9FABA|nr:unnamed protein product [Sphenostylis stenocarpa]
MDADIVEIPSPGTNNTSSSEKQKEVLRDAVIGIDDNDDSADLEVIGDKVTKVDKGKAIATIHDDHQNMELFDDDKSGSGDGHNSDGSYDDDDDDYSDLFSDDFIDADKYAEIQMHLDKVDLPSGIEVPIPWLAEFDLGSKKTNNDSLSPWSGANNSQATDSSQPSLILEPTNLEIQGLSAGPSATKRKADTFYASDASVFEAKKRALDELLKWGGFTDFKTEGKSDTPYHSPSVGSSFHFPRAGFTSDKWSKKGIQFLEVPEAVLKSSLAGPSVPFHVNSDILFDNPWFNDFVGDENNEAASNSTVATISDEARDEILRKFHNFKQFDVIEDTSDHYYVEADLSMQQHSKNRAKRIQEEWKSLEKDLPDSIFIRVYESRIDLLRAVIIGADGTPYHDGLFFFDVLFPSNYPNVPPEVHYHSYGVRLNPNLYYCGKVCLSLLNTWSSRYKNEKWVPGVSTVLQILVSIQGLILNSEPYFNEPSNARLRGSKEAEDHSLYYNETTFILSLRTMVHVMRRTPKNFEDFVAGHFCSRAHDILVACKAYMDGAQVGCLAPGGVQDVDQGDKSSSKHFKKSLAAYVNMLIPEFTKIGAKDCDKVFPPKTVVEDPLKEMPQPAAIPDEDA